MDDRIDLDDAAQEIEARRESWRVAGITIGETKQMAGWIDLGGSSPRTTSASPEGRFSSEAGAHERTDVWEPPPVGSLIRLMGDYGADMPLWEEGLLLADPDEGVRLLGLSQGLALALQDWGTGWDGREDHAQRDADAEMLLARLRSELGDRYEFRYHR